MPRKQKIDFNQLELDYQALVKKLGYMSLIDAARALNISKSTIKRLNVKRNMANRNPEHYKKNKSLEMRLLAKEKKIQQINNELQKSNDKCSICLARLMSEPTKTLPCWHTFHHDCITEWRDGLASRSCDNFTCPLCREIFEVNKQPMEVEYGVKKILKRRINKALTNRIEYLILWQK